MTYEKLLEIDKNSEKLFKFIDGEIYSQASPSTIHQDILGNLFFEFKSHKVLLPFI